MAKYVITSNVPSYNKAWGLDVGNKFVEADSESEARRLAVSISGIPAAAIQAQQINVPMFLLNFLWKFQADPSDFHILNYLNYATWILIKLMISISNWYEISNFAKTPHSGSMWKSIFQRVWPAF